MLVLSVKRGERVVVNDDLVIEICDTRVDHGEKTVTLGFSAPESYSIWREKIYQNVAKNKFRGDVRNANQFQYQ